MVDLFPVLEEVIWVVTESLLLLFSVNCGTTVWCQMAGKLGGDPSR